MKDKINVLMCCSDLSVKGGMVSVVKNFLDYDNWEEFDINFVPTHVEKNKIFITLFFLKAYIKIISLALRKKIDIAYLHTSERGSVYRKAIILNTLRKFGIKTVLHHHGAEFEEFFSNLTETKRRYISGTLEKADINIVLSKCLVNMIKDKALGSKVEVIYNSVAVKTNEYNPDGCYILFLGRLGERKGTYDLLKAIAQIDREVDSKYKFLLCGDGALEDVKNEVEKLGIEHRITHMGWIGLEEKKIFFKNTILNVLPSYNEGLPMTILETMSYGIPNISTPIASIPEVIVNNSNGVLVNPGDVDTLACTIKKLIENRELRVRMSGLAYNTIKERFAINANMEKLKEILRNL